MDAAAEMHCLTDRLGQRGVVQLAALQLVPGGAEVEVHVLGPLRDLRLQRLAPARGDGQEMGHVRGQEMGHVKGQEMGHMRAA